MYQQPINNRTQLHVDQCNSFVCIEIIKLVQLYCCTVFESSFCVLLQSRSRGGAKKDALYEDDSMDMGAATSSGAQLELTSLEEKILMCPVNTEMVLSDAGYRKHLIKHSNK